jgi:hypothetical protein
MSSLPLQRMMKGRITAHALNSLRMNYDSFITSRRPEYMPQSQTVPLLFCLMWCLLIFVSMETCVNPWQRFDLHQRIRCSRNLCLQNGCLANGLPLPAFRRYLPNRYLAMVIFVTILYACGGLLYCSCKIILFRKTLASADHPRPTNLMHS